MGTNRRVKIVLPSRNEGEWLRITVDSILEHTRRPPFEVLVLLNGDESTSVSFLEDPAYRGTVRCRRVAEPLGVGRSVNEAVAPGDATHYVFLDAHCLLEQDDWLERAVDLLDAHPGVSMAQPEVLHFTYDGAIEAGRPLDETRIVPAGFEYAIRWRWPYDKPRSLAEVEDSPQRHEPYEGMAGGGMAVFMRAETFHRLGRYDPEVSGWYPETMDYCVRAWLLGHPMMVDPGIRVLHRHGGARRDDAAFADAVHGVLRTAFKYLTPRRRDLAQLLFCRHGFGPMVEEALRRIEKGSWLAERAAHLRDRVRDDDWLFARFGVYEEAW